MKVATSVLALILCTLIGYMKAFKVDERLEFINCVLEDIRKISMQLEFTSEPIYIIIDKIRMSSKIAPIWERIQKYMNDGNNCKAAWEKAIDEGMLYMLQDEERAGLENFFDTLGRRDIDSEKKNIIHTYKILDDIKGRIEKETENKKRIYKSLGPLVGVAFAILII